MYSSGNNANFADLMSIARQNADDAKRKARHTNGLLPEIGRPKRADPKQVKLKEGVAKFLAKREEEEKKKKQEEKLKKERLEQLRQQDRKATNRVKKMLTMTKSANKSCVEDARDSLNASIAAQGEIQPDEDDYGYTSNYADLMHKKIMEKYKSIPIKPLFSESSGVPVPKHQSFQKNGSGWRNKHDDESSGYSPEQECEEPVPSKKPEKSSKVPKKPPPPDYRQLLQLAQQKQLEPVLPTKTLIEKKDRREEFEYGRPMTAKEKLAFLAEKDLKERSIRRFEQNSSDRNNNSSSDSKAAKPSASFKIPKAKSKEEPAAAPSPPKKSKMSENDSNGRILREELTSKPVREEPPARHHSSAPSNTSPSTQHRPNPPTNKPNGLKPSTSMSSLPPKPRPESQKSSKSHSSSNSSPPTTANRKELPRNELPKPERPPERKIPDKMELIKQRPKYLSAFEGGKERDRDRDHERRQVETKPRPGTSKTMVSQQQRPIDSRDRDRDRDRERVKVPNEIDRRPPIKKDSSQQPRKYMDPPERRNGAPPPRREPPMKGPPHRGEFPRMKPKPHKGRAIIDSDEEYDSEMDDFIDDSEVDMGNISEEISRIFNYNRRQYHYEESDDECMESSVAEQMREEQRSLRIGIQEDLEDIRREEEEKKRKLMKMKRR